MSRRPLGSGSRSAGQNPSDMILLLAGRLLSGRDEEDFVSGYF